MSWNVVPVLYCYLEHEAVPDLCPTDVLAVGVADAHGAGGGRTRVGDRPRRCQHRHVEAVLDGLHASLVDAADAIGLRLEGDELGMLLDHQDEVCLALDDKKSCQRYFLIKCVATSNSHRDGEQKLQYSPT